MRMKAESLSVPSGDPNRVRSGSAAGVPNGGGGGGELVAAAGLKTSVMSVDEKQMSAALVTQAA